jgi:hypothetical protein
MKEDTIQAVSATSITTSKDKMMGRKQGEVIGGDGSKTISVTYKITSLTTIEVNGQEAGVDALQPGMSVTVAADAPDGMDAPDPTNGGTATAIIAHDAPRK